MAVPEVWLVQCSFILFRAIVCWQCEFQPILGRPSKAWLRLRRGGRCHGPARMKFFVIRRGIRRRLTNVPWVITVPNFWGHSSGGNDMR